MLRQKGAADKKRERDTPHDAPKQEAFVAFLVVVVVAIVTNGVGDEEAFFLLRVAAGFVNALLLLAAKGAAPRACGTSAERISRERKR